MSAMFSISAFSTPSERRNFDFVPRHALDAAFIIGEAFRCLGDECAVGGAAFENQLSHSGKQGQVAADVRLER